MILRHGGYSVLVDPSFYDMDRQLEYMERNGIRTKVISLANPWVDCFPRGEAVLLSGRINDWISGVVERNQGRFLGLATLPMRDPDASADELRRAVAKLGLRGAIIGTNIRGKGIDSKEYWPVYEEADRLHVPIFIHPVGPPFIGLAGEFSLSPAVLFPYETCLAVTRIVLSGLLLNLPNLRFFIPHLGGVLPYLAGRIDKAYEISHELVNRLPEPPSFYFKRNFYSDTIVFDKDTLSLGYRFFGPEHLVIGTDYPFALGRTDLITSLLDNLHLPEGEMEQVEFKTALALLGKSS